MYPAGINGGLPTIYLDPIANPFDERAMRSEKLKLILRDFTADPRPRNNALYDIANDPGESDNLCYQAEYRKQLEQQLELMLRHAEDMGDTLAIKLARKELNMLNHPEEFAIELF